MNKIVKIFMVLAVLALLTMPASARLPSDRPASSTTSIDRYIYKVYVSGPNSIRVEGYNRDNTALYLGNIKGAEAAARDVMTLALNNKMKVRRTSSDVKEEINTHAVLYLMGERVHSMPVDIGVNEWNGVWIADGSWKMVKTGGNWFKKTMTTQRVY